MSFADVLRTAISDFAERGYQSQEQLEQWISQIRQAAEAELVPPDQVEEELKRALGSVYTRMIDQGNLLTRHPDVGKYTIERVRPAARAELRRSIFASANLIKLNRRRAVEETVQRFSGWASSVPAGGSRTIKRRDVSQATRAELRKLAYESRRVSIDQGHKFAAALDRVVADESGAIAVQWHQHFTRYPRDTHKQRDGKWYLIRGSWAQEQGLVRAGPGGFLQDITQPGEEINCRCTCTYYSTLRRLPADLLTEKGREKMAELRRVA
jgi:hypothetical protein